MRIISYHWEFGDGTNGAGAVPVHTYAAAGTYSVKLTVTDDRGASGNATTTAAISAAQPTASGAGTGDRLAKWLDGTGTLGDSSVSDVNGLVGIGTTSPTQKLEVFGNSKYVGPAGSWAMGTAHHVFVSDDGSPVGFQNTRPDAGSGAQMFDHTGVMKAFFQWHNQSAPNGNSLNFATAQNDPITFTTNTYNARMTITGPGNVGIGTTSPQSALQVNGYLQLALTPGAPPAADCDAAAEYGRMKVDAIGVRVYVCTAAGWKSTALQ